MATLLGRLGDQWTRFLLGSVFSVRHSDLLLRTAQTVLQQLYDLLLGPVADQLPGDAVLRIVPHRLLHQVPFHALHDGRRYVVQQRSITVLPTLAGTAAEPAGCCAPPCKASSPTACDCAPTRLHSSPRWPKPFTQRAAFAPWRISRPSKSSRDSVW